MDLRPGDVRRVWRSISRALIYRVPGECEQCPACRSRRLYELDVLPLRRSAHGRHMGFVSGCNDCGLVFTNPPPSPQELMHFYSPSGDWGASRAAAAGSVPETTGDTRGHSWSKLFEPIRDRLCVTAPPLGARALDFGCGSGKLLDALQDCGWDTSGIEPALDVAFRRHARLHVIPDEPTFDLIVANHVLEHVPDPLTLLRQFARACRTGGYVFIGVPRFDTLPIHRDYKYAINGRAHVTAYTWACLQGLLARAGWAPVAPPPDRISKGRGRTTPARLRVIARRVETTLALPPSPADEARAAIRRYHAETGGRSLLERWRFYRLAARRAEARRRQAIIIRKSAKIGVTL